MFGRQERLAIILLLTVALVVIASYLALDYLGKRPFATPYSDKAGDGDLVIKTGTIDSLSVTRTGGHLILTIDNLTIFVPNGIAYNLTVQKGTNVSVIGMVQTYAGKKEIVVQSASDITPVP
jgi:DNA/RNA endonuclease YhcR with UshA esterase domain